MRQLQATVREKVNEAEGMYRLSLVCPEIAHVAQPGQFVSIRPTRTYHPFWRRPYSIMRADDESIQILFSVVGAATNILKELKNGDPLDIIGPLGRPFGWETGFRTALLVGGGIGIAPLPFLSEKLAKKGKEVIHFFGTRTKSMIPQIGLKGLNIATDDGSMGFHGNVVSLLERHLTVHQLSELKIFGCGPTVMMKALAGFAQKLKIECELSLETEMACGVGLCQGCVVELKEVKKKYALTCTDGAVFNARDVVL
jgi:dihydroorotate dehydrogenase electron transfer subunit